MYYKMITGSPDDMLGSVEHFLKVEQHFISQITKWQLEGTIDLQCHKVNRQMGSRGSAQANETAITLEDFKEDDEDEDVGGA